ncbi:MAG: hypothetical protein R3C26_10030 [Calditrichia bacterium]
MKRESLASLILFLITLIFSGQIVGQTAELQWEHVRLRAIWEYSANAN